MGIPDLAQRIGSEVATLLAPFISLASLGILRRHHRPWKKVDGRCSTLFLSGPSSERIQGETDSALIISVGNLASFATSFSEGIIVWQCGHQWANTMIKQPSSLWLCMNCRTASLAAFLLFSSDFALTSPPMTFIISLVITLGKCLLADAVVELCEIWPIMPDTTPAPGSLAVLCICKM